MAHWRAALARTFLVAISVAVLAAGAVSAGAASRKAPPPPPPTKGPVEYLKSLLPFTDVEPAQDFVRDSRPAEPGPFIPVGNEPADQELRVKSPAELAAMKADLEKARSVHEGVRAHPPALTMPAGPPAPPAAAGAGAAPAKQASKRGPRHKRAAAAD